MIGDTVWTGSVAAGRVGRSRLEDLCCVPGIFVLAIGITLQAGATRAVRAIKLSASLTAGRHFESAPPEAHVTQ